MSDYDSDVEEGQELDLSNSDVVTKYKAAADITNNALAAVIKAAKAGAKLVDLCSLGDKSIEDASAKVFKGKTIEKGIAFPTCTSVNNVIGHVSPLAEDTVELKEGDVVKIDLGSHIDGFVATAAHTIVVQSDAEAPVTGKAADVIVAANTALEAAIRLIRPGKRISEVTGVLGQVAEAYGVSLVEGVLSHQLKQFVIDGNKCVLNKASPEYRVEDGEFEENEVYGIDIVVSSGEGKGRVLDERETTVYKRALDQEYKLKLKASRSIFSEINKKHPTMPFTTRGLDSKQSRLGILECLNHGLLHPYPVLHEKNGEVVAQFKATVLLMPNGSDRITAAPLQKVDSDKKVENEDLKKLLASSVKSKKKNKPKKKKAAPKNGEADEEQTAGEAAEEEAKTEQVRLL
ncbi:proliferation-associated protein 1 [Coccomyxa subellipsoidea C-169]|uniref:Proliferation-associated protein 1 n=1 Tax=Coccomyxa subellipsoidea (strain C-169) TaxID=574566 RepID=I0Z667_COCSC|nr:proliferation-associated protein 1 [Coccomyxa subellipsoidea C-169]EIE26136.1 proliferation-associated protein 1 [Coccomyxa subellipsoidea C-169]|eukprot:XP_005650680.1 proliferation-associated protein 1 [Coccomyxa subellipsoidea C-169]